MQCTLHNKPDLFPVYKYKTYSQGYFDFSKINILDWILNQFSVPNEFEEVKTN